MEGRKQEPSETEFRINKRNTVTLRKMYTPNGNRLKIDSTENKHAISLDAVQLESLTWQKRDELLRLHERSTSSGCTEDIRTFWENTEGAEPESREHVAKITNEYAEAYINSVFIGDRECCEIVSPKIGYGRRLTPEEFLSVAERGPEIFNRFLQTPFGPEEEL